MASEVEPMRAMDKDALPLLLSLLQDDGFGLVGPTVRDGAIVYEEIEGADDLPLGIRDAQAPGYYRLREDGDASFGYVVGPQSWKRFMAPPRETLVQLRRPGDAYAAAPTSSEPRAFIGVRSCELAGDRILGQVFEGGPHVDPRHARRRAQRFVVAVNCLEPGGLCFCASMDTGPRAKAGFDIALTELGDTFLLEASTEQGRAVVDRLPTRPATEAQRQRLDDGTQRARQSMGRTLDKDRAPALLLGNLEHPRWDAIAERCLSCGNCTQVCPTCFCHAVEHHSVVGQDDVTTERRWDSCFTPDHSYVHGGRFRPTTADRYRQWMTHKLSSWVSQFGSSGCVGCGRCIAWCPVGIDITQEIQAIAADAAPPIEPPPFQPRPPLEGDAMLPVRARVRAVVQETSDVFTLTLETPEPLRDRPGQFNMLSLPGVGEPPISISGHDGETALHTIRAVGAATRALCELQAGDTLGLRGPFGTGWPLEEARGHRVMVITGGIGLAPLRGAIREMVSAPELYPSVRLLYGARTPDDVLYDEELLEWNRIHPHFKASVSVDHAGDDWTGHVGFVTNLIRRKDTPPDGVYMLCGPEVMMRACIRELLADGVPPSRIHLSMERNMHCAAGFCGRCQVGPYFICKDGPVFRYDQISTLFTTAGL